MGVSGAVGALVIKDFRLLLSQDEKPSATIKSLAKRDNL
jgi:hypothetical protein